MHRAFAFALLVMTFAAPAFAQQAPQAPPTVAGFVRNLYNGNKNNITRSAEKMPEEFYGLRPGAQEEVRTFAQHVLHSATFNFLWCSQAKGEANPNAGRQLERMPMSKAEVVKVLADSFAYCDGAYQALTDASGAEIVTITQENGRETRQARMALLILNVAHNNETYGNMVTTMRIKNIVPTSSEPRPQPAAQ